VTDQPVLLVRYRPGVVGEALRIVHVVTVSPGDPADVVGARCGAILIPGDLETVAPGEGMPCTPCVLRCVITAEELPGHDPDQVNPTAIDYQQWGWPVTQHRNQSHLNLDHAVSALMIPATLSAELLPMLTQRRCSPPTLAHPDAPEHHIVLTGEKFGIRLPWPEQVHPITGALPLPPTPTARGPITWIITPHRDSLRLCREIDLFTALRAYQPGTGRVIVT
jgi:hypothetical protein